LTNNVTENKVIATKIKNVKGFSNLVVNTWEKVLKKYTEIPNEWLQSSTIAYWVFENL